MKKILTLLILIGLSQALNAQSNRITGKVMDQNGVPVAYASISFKGSSKFGTLTSVDGRFDSFVPTGSDTIVCTHVNFKKKLEAITGNNFITLILEKKQPKENTISISRKHHYSKQEIENPDIPNPAVDEARNFTKIEMEAYFPGGENNLTKYLQEHIIYPDSATISNVNGIVKVGFTINIDGYPKNIILLRGVNKFANEAVIKAISDMPRWERAMQNGRFVEAYKEIAVSFDIKGIIN